MKNEKIKPPMPNNIPVVCGTIESDMVHFSYKCSNCKKQFNAKYIMPENSSAIHDLVLACPQCQADTTVRVVLTGHNNISIEKKNTPKQNRISILNKIEIKPLVILILCLVAIGVAIVAFTATQSNNSSVTSQSASSSVATARYIGNSNSMKFHKKSCSHLPDKDSQVYYTTREQAIKDGMKPCKICNP